MRCNGTVGLSAGHRVAEGDSFWLRPVCPDGRLTCPHPELEFTLYAPATSGAHGGQDAAGRRLTFFADVSRSCPHIRAEGVIFQ